MTSKVLEFERPIVELEGKIRELKLLSSGSGEMAEEIERLEEKARQLQRDRFAALTPWEQVQLAKHPDRPYTLDYLGEIATEFMELRGDRCYADDPAIVGGPCRIDGQAVIALGHQKGRNTKENLYRNFGMARPEGYRKAQRFFRMAEQFGRPLLCLIDTAGAYPGIGAEERGQSEAIGRNLYAMAGFKVPIVTTIIGEGGSGGALAIAVGDVVNMLQYSTYSVISPEGCASILWKSAEQAPEAAETLGITATRLKTLGLIDRIINEPLGGAHRDPQATGQAVRKAIQESLRQLSSLTPRELVDARFERLMAHGRYKEAAAT